MHTILYFVAPKEEVYLRQSCDCVFPLQKSYIVIPHKLWYEETFCTHFNQLITLHIVNFGKKPAIQSP